MTLIIRHTFHDILGFWARIKANRGSLEVELLTLIPNATIFPTDSKTFHRPIADAFRVPFSFSWLRVGHLTVHDQSCWQSTWYPDTTIYKVLPRKLDGSGSLSHCLMGKPQFQTNEIFHWRQNGSNPYPWMAIVSVILSTPWHMSLMGRVTGILEPSTSWISNNLFATLQPRRLTAVAPSKTHTEPFSFATNLPQTAKHDADDLHIRFYPLFPWPRLPWYKQVFSSRHLSCYHIWASPQCPLAWWHS